MQLFWLCCREELTIDTPLDYSALPAVKKLSLSQFGVTGFKANFRIKPDLNKLRQMELGLVQAEYIAHNDPTTQHDLLFMNMWIQTFDRSSISGKVSFEIASYFDVVNKDRIQELWTPLTGLLMQ